MCLISNFVLTYFSICAIPPETRDLFDISVMPGTCEESLKTNFEIIIKTD